MARPGNQLLDLLEPIFRNHAASIEAGLPPALRLNWRKAAANVGRNRGRKSLDYRDLLLAKAERDSDMKRTPRELAAEVVASLRPSPNCRRWDHCSG